MVNIRVNPTNENIRVDVNNVDSDIDIKANNINASVNTGIVGDKYYTDLAKEWAIKMNGKVLGEDYSSKYWAQESKGYAEQAEEIIQSKDEILAELAEEGTTQKNLIENTGTEQIGIVAEATNAQIERIENEGNTQTSNIINVSNTNIATMNGLVDNARSSALSAANSKDNAEIWAEGTDEQVALLGGIHSAKGWADVSSTGQEQADWEETDTTSKTYIKNKPTIPTKTSELINDSNFATTSQIPTNNNQLTNGAGYITGIDGSDITSALGYVPYDSTNPNGYTSNIGTVTSVNGIQPINGNVALTIPTIDIDNTTITTNANDELQAVALIDNNTSNAIKTWTGTRAQYDAIVTKDSNTLYNIIDDTDVTLSLLELLYPVGSIYIGTMATCPLARLGVGTWQLVATDRVLQGAGTNTVGSTVEAGLPNITGTFKGFNNNASGAFTITEVELGNVNTAASQEAKWDFDASRSSSIYGNSSTVQPPAYIVNIWERIS